jgi:magnesium transporter
MLILHGIREKRLVRLDPAPGVAEEVAWIDLVAPTAEEEERVERFLGIEVPTREEMAEIEVSSRLYREGDVLYMTASLVTGADTALPESCPVTFILTKARLVTVRYAEPSVFRVFAQQAAKSDADLKNGDSIFVGLLEAIIDRTADVLEGIGRKMDAISRSVFQKEVSDEGMSRDYKSVLRKIGRGGDLNAKARESLVSLGRLVNYVSAECGDLHPGLRERTETMAADIRSLTDHASYLAGTAVFQLDATLGLINIEQNAIIKIVSVAAVVFLPPTLVASIYGMNFDAMPELEWLLGYPLALGLMVLSAVLPYVYFKRRGWL